LVEMLQLLLEDTVAQMPHLELLIQVMLEATVVAQTLHLEQVINNFRNRYGSFFSDSLSTVLGGMSILLYGVIASNGLKVLIKERVDFGQMRNLIIASAMLVLGLGGAILKLGPVTLLVTALSAMTGIILNLILPYENKD